MYSTYCGRHGGAPHPPFSRCSSRYALETGIPRSWPKHSHMSQCTAAMYVSPGRRIIVMRLYAQGKLGSSPFQRRRPPPPGGAPPRTSLLSPWLYSSLGVSLLRSDPQVPESFPSRAWVGGKKLLRAEEETALGGSFRQPFPFLDGA